jgi:hypothetical protein
LSEDVWDDTWCVGSLLLALAEELAMLLCGWEISMLSMDPSLSSTVTASSSKAGIMSSDGKKLAKSGC